MFSFNSTGRNVTVFDALNGSVLGTIAVDGRTEFYAMDGKGMIYDRSLPVNMISPRRLGWVREAQQQRPPCYPKWTREVKSTPLGGNDILYIE